MPGYWLDLWTWTSWQEFLAAGGTVSGFRERRWKTVQRIRPGDYLLCYLTGISRFIGVLEVISQPFKDSIRIYADDLFPCRLKVKVVSRLTPETAVPVLSLKDKLWVFEDLKNPNAWTGHFRGSPARWKVEDGQVVVAAIEEAQKNPVERPVDQGKLARRPKAFQAKLGPVTVPDTEVPSSVARPEERSQHTEIQWLLATLGSNMGLDVWVARNDRGREWGGKQFTDLKLRDGLPVQFDEATNRTIELIDLLWLKGSAIVAAFEIESTTSIYSGLLRMADLISMQPNLNIPLFIVAPDERRDRVIQEVNRPTFARLPQPMGEICRFIPFSALRQRLPGDHLVRHLNPSFLDELSESCETEEG